MAVLKVINRIAKDHAGLKNVIDYITKKEKIPDRLVAVTGPMREIGNWQSAYDSFLDEKKVWGKDSGRMYSHTVISFHKNEKITPMQARRFGREFAKKWFHDYQCIISVHQDRDHLHVHIVSNSVNYIDGHKYHTNKHDLERMKALCNEMCRERGLSVPVKGRHYDGTPIREDEIITWRKDQYQTIKRLGGDSYLVRCAFAIKDAVGKSADKDEFERELGDRGWSIEWHEDRQDKKITFIDKADSCNKVSNDNLQQIFNMQLQMEDLIHEFARVQEIRRKREQKEQEFREYEERAADDYIAGLDAAITAAELARGDAEEAARDSNDTTGYDRDTEEDDIRFTGPIKECTDEELYAYRARQRDQEETERIRHSDPKERSGDTEALIREAETQRRVISADGAKQAAIDSQSKAYSRERRSEESKWVIDDPADKRCDKSVREDHEEKGQEDIGDDFEDR